MVDLKRFELLSVSLRGSYNSRYTTNPKLVKPIFIVWFREQVPYLEVLVYKINLLKSYNTLGKV